MTCFVQLQIRSAAVTDVNPVLSFFKFCIHLLLLVSTYYFAGVGRYNDLQLGPINSLSFAFVDEFDYR